MACRYYDDAIIAKLTQWIPENSNLKILKPDETRRFFETTADDKKDSEFTLPCIALSRNNEIQLLSTTKDIRSFDGLRITNTRTSSSGTIIYDDISKTALLNVIPIRLNYQLDIYTKTYEDGEEYVRNFLFKLINNPQIIIDIPYNGQQNLRNTAYIRVADTVSDTSSISERIFSGQFTRWTIQFELQDAYLYSVPYKKNWRIITNDNSHTSTGTSFTGNTLQLTGLEICEKPNTSGEVENID